MPLFDDLHSRIWRMAQNPGESTLNNGLLGAWPLDDAGTGNRFDYSEAPKSPFVNNNAAGSIVGEIGTYLIESSDQYLSIDYAGNTGLWQDTTGEISVSASFQVFEWPVTSGINLPAITLWNANTSNRGFAMYVLSDISSPARAIVCDVSSDGSASQRIEGPVVALDNWYHIMFRYDGSNLYLQVNGSDETPVSYSSGMLRPTSIPWTIGRYIPPNGIPIYADILIKNVNIWNRGLTDAEVTEWYNGGEPLSIPFQSTS